MWQWLLDLLAKLRPAVVTGADKPTAGPPEDEHPLVQPAHLFEANNGPAFKNGWWTREGCQMTPANPGRIGGVIVPQKVVLHSTDMVCSAHTLVRAWQQRVGAGNAATFLVGRDKDDGVYQFCPITRNSNHAGGAKHGWFRTAGGHLIHPNAIAVGIEVHCAGRLRLEGMKWYHPDSGKVIPTEQVYVDEHGHGWQKPTDWQLGVLSALLHDLYEVIPLKEPLTWVPDADLTENGVAWAAVPPTSWLVGHATLDPLDRSDPGPQLMRYCAPYTAA